MESSAWLSLLVDPIDRQPLHLDDRELIAASDVRYPIVDGIRVLIRPDLPPTHRSSIRTVKMVELARQGLRIDPVASSWALQRMSVHRAALKHRTK